MAGKKGRPEILKEILNPIIARTGLSWRVKEQKIIDRWREIVGEDIAQNTQPGKYRGGVLYIKVSNSIWMHQLQFLKKMIIDKICAEIKEILIEDLRFFIGEVQGGGSGEEAFTRINGVREAIKKDPGNIWEIPKEITEEIAQVKDPEIRALLFTLYAKIRSNLKESHNPFPEKEWNRDKKNFA